MNLISSLTSPLMDLMIPDHTASSVWEFNVPPGLEQPLLIVGLIFGGGVYSQGQGRLGGLTNLIGDPAVPLTRILEIYLGFECMDAHAEPIPSEGPQP